MTKKTNERCKEDLEEIIADTDELQGKAAHFMEHVDNNDDEDLGEELYRIKEVVPQLKDLKNSCKQALAQDSDLESVTQDLLEQLEDLKSNIDDCVASINKQTVFIPH